jgi:hypothetical protein
VELAEWEVGKCIQKDAVLHLLFPIIKVPLPLHIGMGAIDGFRGKWALGDKDKHGRNGDGMCDMGGKLDKSRTVLY